MDLTVTIITAPVWLVVLSVIAVGVLFFLGRPVFFIQERPGFRSRPFGLIKFRTMTTRRGEDGALLPDKLRLSSFGRFLRSTSLDELPELINVLKGQMSLVGPRPLLTDYLPLYSKRQAHRHDVLPGITGWAQVNGRNLTPWHIRLEQDVWYAENITFALDLRILWRTTVTVIRRHGITATGEATMSRFAGEVDEDQ